MHTYIYIYKHIYIHTYTHTYCQKQSYKHCDFISSCSCERMARYPDYPFISFLLFSGSCQQIFFLQLACISH